MKRNKKAFTLLEVVIAMVILTIASVGVGWKIAKAIEKKKFQSSIDCLKSRFLMSRQLSMTMQADWQGVLKREKKGWTLETVCVELKTKKLPPLHLSPFELFFDGKKVEKLELNFFSTGQVVPEGVLRFSSSAGKVEWKTSELFQCDQGQKLGPTYPLILR